MSTRKSLLQRFDELIELGTTLNSKSFPDFLPRKGRWQTSCLHLLERTFGADNIFYKKFEQSLKYTDDSQLAWGTELMRGAKEEIEKGLLFKIEHLISNDLFDSVTEQAEYLLKNGFKDVAAILGRVVTENTLKAVAKRENIQIQDGIKLSEINQSLRKNDVYPKNIWRVTQGYIDLGNYAAHGEFDKYDAKAVENMLTWIKETLFNF
jgi:hypothetical protein